MQNDGRRMQNGENPVSADSAFCIHPSAFPRSHRLSGKLRFAAVYDVKRKVTRGPLVMYSLPNQLSHHRLGISIPRRVGTAPVRNRIKRLLREAFRLHRSVGDRHYDLVMVVRPHKPMTLIQYREEFGQLLTTSSLIKRENRPLRSPS